MHVHLVMKRVPLRDLALVDARAFLPVLEIVLLEPKEGPMLDTESAAAVRLLLKKGVLGAGAFETPDCKKTYETLKAKGVQFAGAPEERFYGTEAIMRDGVGNWFSVTQQKPH